MKIKLIILFIFVSSGIYAQNNAIFGKIIDKETHSPISFASIYYENSTNGTISNYEGDFSLQKFQKPLIISCIGYKTQRFEPENFDNDTLNFYLEKDVYELNEILVKGETAKEIIKKAILSKQENYPQKPTIMSAYYTQVSKQNNEIIRLSEIDLELFRPCYEKSKKGKDKVKIINGVSSEDKNTDIGYHSLILHKLIGASLLILDSTYIDNYKLTMKMNNETYNISITPERGKTVQHVNIILEKESYSIIAIEIKTQLQAFDYNEKEAKNYKYKGKRTKFCTSNAIDFIIQYKKLNDLWHLNSMHGKLTTVAYNTRDTIYFKDNAHFMVNEIDVNPPSKFKGNLKGNADIYTKGISNEAMFNNVNKMLFSKEEEKARKQFNESSNIEKF